MTNLANIVRAAQQALESYQPVALDPVEVTRAYFGAEARFEVARFHAAGELPATVRGLELLAIDIKLEEEI